MFGILYWYLTLLKIYHLTYKDLNQIDSATNNVLDRAENNVTARIKDDVRTSNASASKVEDSKKKRRRDPNKHYISGMLSVIN